MTGYRAELTGRVLCASVATGLLHRYRAQLLRRPVARWRGAALAVGVPVALVCSSLGGRGRLHWQRRGVAAEAVVAGYVISGAVAEELLWRAPPLLLTRRGLSATSSALVFAALHVRRDGPDSAAGHLVLTGAWSIAAALDRTVFWPVVGHVLYNYLALSLTVPASERGHVAVR